jgi:outer membrane protein TolC
MKKTVSLSLLVISVGVSGCTSNNTRSQSGRYTRVTHNTETSVSTAVKEKSSLPELTETSQLSDYLAYAALNNPDLEAAFNRFKAALEQLPQAKALPDPRFTYKYFIEEIETRVGPQRHSFGISQLFPWFGKLQLRGDVAAQATNAAQQRYQAAKLKLFFEVKSAYYEYYYLAKSIDVTKENISLITHLETVARSRYKTAAGTHPDVIRAQVELGKLEDRYRSLLDMRQPVIAGLNAALNRPVDMNIPMPDEIVTEQVEIVDTQLLTELTKNNPQLKELDFEIAQNKQRIDLAGKSYYPDFTLGLSFIDTGDAFASNPSDSGKDPVIASVSVNLPLWTGKYDAAVSQARYEHIASIRQKKATTNSLSSDLKMALYRFRDAERKIDLYRDALLPKAKESLKVTEAGFRTAGGGFTDLIDAQQILLEFSLSYERALADRAKALAKLEMLVGKEIPRKGN